MNLLTIFQTKTPSAPPKEKKNPTSTIPKTDGDLFMLNTSKQPIITLLKSQSDEDKLKGLKAVVAMIITRKDPAPFMPYIVNMITTDYKMKKLAYYYLINCCHICSNEILMSINSFHKDLIDQRALIRASALRAISSLKIDEIMPIMLMSVQRTVADFSVYVRRASAYALIKLVHWDENNKENVVVLLGKLLDDVNPLILGPAFYAFNYICPERLDLIHPRFRRICREIETIEPIFIPNLVQVLLRYARFYLDKKYVNENERMDQDFKLFLDSLSGLLYFENPPVLIAAAEAFLLLEYEVRYQNVINALLSFKHQAHDSAYLMISLLEEYAKKVPKLFNHCVSYFYLNNGEHKNIALKKLKILGYVVSETTVSSILKELNVYAHNESEEISTTSISIIGKIVEKNPSFSEPCTKHLILLLKSHSPLITAQVIIVLRRLITQNPSKHRKIIVHCARIVELLQNPIAKASAIWIIGRYYSIIPTLAADCIRKLTINFTKELSPVKHQIMNSAVKMYTESQSPLKERLREILHHLIELASYDSSYDLRDKARLLSLVFKESEISHLESKELFKNNGDMVAVEISESAYFPITVSYLLGKKVNGYSKYWEDLTNKEKLIETLSEDSSGLRDTETMPTLRVESAKHYSSDDIPKIGGSGMAVRVKINNPNDLEEFLASSDEEYEEGSEEEAEEDIE